MGISLYMHVEQHVDGRWQPVPPPNEEFWSDWKSTSSYDAFAVLCNDYRRRGNFELVAPLRGLPDDLSDHVRELVDQCDERWGLSWYLLSELLAFDWQKKVTMKMVLCPAEYLAFREKGQLVGRNPAMEEFVATMGMDAARKYVFGMEGCPCEEATYISTYGEEAVNLMSDMLYLQALGDPTKIRIVVWCTA